MSGGVGQALGEVMDAVGELPDGDQVVQAALFDDLGEADTGRLDAPSPLSAAIQPRASKGGRPKGSRNRRTEAVAAWLLSQHRHPLAVMAEAYSMAPAAFLAAAGFKHDEKGDDDAPCYSNDLLFEALKLQMRMAEVVAPYLAQKQPQAVQLDAQGSVQISLGGVSLPARGQGSAVIEGQAKAVMAVSLPFKSDDDSRTDG